MLSLKKGRKYECRASKFTSVRSWCQHVLWRHILIQAQNRRFWCVYISWCASVYNEDYLVGESWYTRFRCLLRDWLCLQQGFIVQAESNNWFHVQQNPSYWIPYGNTEYIYRKYILYEGSYHRMIGYYEENIVYGFRRVLTDLLTCASDCLSPTYTRHIQNCLSYSWKRTCMHMCTLWTRHIHPSKKKPQTYIIWILATLPIRNRHFPFHFRGYSMQGVFDTGVL